MLYTGLESYKSNLRFLGYLQYRAQCPMLLETFYQQTNSADTSCRGFISIRIQLVTYQTAKGQMRLTNGQATNCVRIIFCIKTCEHGGNALPSNFLTADNRDSSFLVLHLDMKYSRRASLTDVSFFLL